MATKIHQLCRKCLGSQVGSTESWQRPICSGASSLLRCQEHVLSNFLWFLRKIGIFRFPEIENFGNRISEIPENQQIKIFPMFRFFGFSRTFKAVSEGPRTFRKQDSGNTGKPSKTKKIHFPMNPENAPKNAKKYDFETFPCIPEKNKICKNSRKPCG